MGVKLLIQPISVTQDTWGGEEEGEEEEGEGEPSAGCGALVGVWPRGVWGRQGQQKRSGGPVSAGLIRRAGRQARGSSSCAPVLRIKQITAYRLVDCTKHKMMKNAENMFFFVFFLT